MKKRTLTLLTAVLLLATVCGCNGSNGTNGGNAGGTGIAGDTGNIGETAETESPEYVYADLDFKGEEITVAAMEQIGEYNMNFVMDAEASEPLDVAIYESNMRIQEQYNFTFLEDLSPVGDFETRWLNMGNYLIQNFMAGDDVFDFIFYAVGQRPELITRGYLHDLSDFEQLQLEKPWWDASLNDKITINDRLYMASGSINLMPYDGMECLLFNKQILADNSLDSPYDMVRDGTWTLDALYTLASEAMTQGSDTTWWELVGGTSVYGVGMHRDFPAHFLVSAGIEYVTETDGDYNFSLESEDFYTAIEKILPFFTHCSRGGVGGGDASSSDNSERKLFAAGRIAFAMMDVQSAFEIRDSEVEFGFLPLPKLREEQENYITDTYDHLHFIAIPTTSGRPEDVAAVVDALAYDRYKNVVPVYYDSYITYKGVRDEDSLEMLEIMTAGRTIDPGIAYGWCYDFVVQKMSWNITGGTISSMIAENKDIINEDIDAFVDEYFT